MKFEQAGPEQPEECEGVLWADLKKIFQGDFKNNFWWFWGFKDILIYLQADILIDIQINILKLISPDMVSKDWYAQIDILINNAGVMACPEARTSEGFEMQEVTCISVR